MRRKILLSLSLLALLSEAAWAFPAVQGRSQYVQPSARTSHAVTLPTSIASGDLLLVVFVCNGSTTVSWPAGWTELTTDQGSGTSSWAYRVADGSEGSTVTVTTGASREAVARGWRITGHADPAIQAPEFAGVTASTSTPDPPSLTPAGGAKAYLWIAATASGGSDDAVSGFPADYVETLYIKSSTTNIGTLAVAERELNAPSEDPGAFIAANSRSRVSYTVVIHPGDITAPVISDVSVTTVNNTSVTVSWTTDEPASSRMDYGLDNSYGTTVSDATLVTSHSLNLIGLTCNTTYHYQITSADDAGNSASTDDATFTTDPCGPPVSDDFFNAPLNTSLWTVVDPLGDGSVSTDGTRLLLSVPEGTAHNVWTEGNHSVRVIQTIGNVDFQVEVKFESAVSQQSQIQGLLAGQDDGNFVRFDVHYEGSTPRFFAASFVDGTPTTRLSTGVSGITQPVWLRVTRAGNDWTLSYSTDGATFTDVGTFTHALTTAWIGPFVGNSALSGETPPAFTSAVDYFFNTASPIDPEDGGGADISPPMISDVSVKAFHTEATISWTTDEDTTGRVDYGTTSDYGTSVEDTTLSTSHSVTLTGLTCGTVYHYQVSATDGAGNTTSTADATFSTTTCQPPVSDDFFSSTLDTTLWTIVDPVGDGTVTMTGTNLLLSVPEGTSHNVWVEGNRSLRVIQAIGNQDFEVEVKFESAVTQKYQMQGILVGEDEANFLRFEVHHDGASTRMFAASFVDGTPTTRLDTAVSGVSQPVWLRVARTGDSWSMSYSNDSLSYLPLVTFSHALRTTWIGPFAANHALSGNPPPAFTASVDYFFNTASPISPEDGETIIDSTPPTIGTVSVTVSSDSATITWTTDEEATTRVDYGLDTSYGLFLEDTTLVTEHSVLLPGLLCNTTYHFKVTSADIAGNTTSTPDATFTTDACTVTVEARSQYVQPSARTSHSVPLPAGIGSGNLLLCAFVANGSTTATWPAGWTKMTQDTGSGTASWAYRQADGSEGSAISVTTGASREAVARCWRITGHTDPAIQAPEFAGVTATTASPDPPSLTPAGGAYLWIAATASGGSNDNVRGFPADYVETLYIKSSTTNIGTLAVAERKLSAASEDPGAFTAANSRSRVSYTVGIRPAASGSTSGDTTAPSISEVGVTNVTEHAATVIWNTNEPATSKVEYGTSTSYGTTVEDTTLVTSHTLDLLGLTCNTTYNFRITSADEAGNTTSTGNNTFMTSACTGQGPASDDFHATSLNTVLWQVVDPVGDGKVTLDGTNLLLSLPTGNSHDPAATNRSLRILQSTADVDFQIEAKFDSLVKARFQMQGVFVEQDDFNFLRFEIHHDGVGARIFVGAVSGGTLTTLLNAPLCRTFGPMWLRITRTGNDWTFGWSTDGAEFQNALTFLHTLTVNHVGPYAGNHKDSGAPSPGFTASVDYFFNNSSRIDPEDGGAPDMPVPAARQIIDVWYGDTQNFGHNGVPQQWVNVVGNVCSAGVTFSSLSYTLNGGPAQELWMGPNEVRLTEVGDFNVEIDHLALNSGANSVVITASDSNGNLYERAVTVNWTSGQTWPQDYSINWTTAAKIEDVAQVTDGMWRLEPDGTVRTLQMAYDRLITLGDKDLWGSSYEVETEFTVHSFDWKDFFGVGVVIGWKGHTTNNYGTPLPDQPRTGHPFYGLGWYSRGPTRNNGNPMLEIRTNTESPLQIEKTLASQPDRRLEEGVRYKIRFRVEPMSGGGSRFSLKVWEASLAEPSAWDLVGDNVTSSGSAILGVHRCDVSFGPVVVRSLP